MRLVRKRVDLSEGMTGALLVAPLLEYVVCTNTGTMESKATCPWAC